MDKICVYTCITGDYDNLNEVLYPEKNIDYICFTNNKKIKSRTWKIIYISDDSLNDVKLARKIKILGHPYIQDNYDISIWVDGAFYFNTNVSKFLNDFCDFDKYSMFIPRHSVRDCIYDEAIACYQGRKESKDIIQKGINFLEKNNYPHHTGLVESGVIVRKHNDIQVIKVMNDWFNVIKKFSKRDQLSFNYCAYINNFDFKYIEINIYNNDYFLSCPHNSRKKIKDFRAYFDNGKKYDWNNDVQDNYVINKNIYNAYIHIPINSKRIEFEISALDAMYLKNVKIDYKNETSYSYYNVISASSGYMYIFNDSKMYINGDFIKGATIKISLTLVPLSDEELLILIDRMNYYFNQKNKVMSEKISSIENSGTWIIMKPIRKFLKFIRKCNLFRN